MTLYLPTVTKLGILEAEAGNRAQSDNCYGLTLALIGSSYEETEPKKATYLRAGRNIQKTLTSLEPNPRHILSVIVTRVLGIQWLNWLLLTERNNLIEGTNKNEIWV
ncbi:MAG: hypothetical protein F6K58_20625 [Symploca sp. SIO2E9]|nr:hypothetical protein [Symploca sp. SIO2E9]